MDKLVAMAEEEEAKAEEKRKMILEEKKRVEDARKKILEDKGDSEDTVTNKEETGNTTVANGEESQVDEGEGEEQLKEQVASPDNGEESTDGAADLEEEVKEDEEGGNGETENDDGGEEAADGVEEGDDDNEEKSPGEDQESSFEPAKFNLMTGSSSSSAASIASANTR